METAVITCIDDNFLNVFEKDFLPTLRGAGKYKGPVYLIYSGKNRKLGEALCKKHGVNFVFSEKRMMVVNQRHTDIANLIDNLPSQISHVFLIDSDVWFQAPIDDVFKLVKNGYGFVEEEEPGDKGFNLSCILQIKDSEIKKAFLDRAKGQRMVGAGMIAGKKENIKKINIDVANLIEKIGQDFFGVDQIAFNFVVRGNGEGVVLPRKYDFSLITNPNQFEIKNRLFYDHNKQLINVVHNSGSNGRMFPNGRSDMRPVPKFPKKLSGKFWGVTTFFNPANYKNKIDNYKIFRNKTKKQGLKLLTVEFSYGDNFELKEGDADILIQIKAKDAMWQKERMLNIGIENLPEDCDRFVWLDNDIIFCNDNWVKETTELLNNYAIVQPFESVIRMGKGEVSAPLNTPFGYKSDTEGLKSHGLACKVSKIGKTILKRTMNFYGVSGFAWAARREIFAEHGLFDKDVCSPAGDLLMAYSFYDNEGFNDDIKYHLNEKLKASLENWGGNIRKEIKNSVYFTNGTLLHLWHGSLENRNYQECHRILFENDFDPEIDIKKGKNGCWEWSSAKEKLHKDLEKYFFIRNEDGSSFTKMLFILKNWSYMFFRVKIFIFLKFDRGLGIVGLYLKKRFPKIYFKILNLKFYKKFLKKRDKIILPR